MLSKLAMISFEEMKFMAPRIAMYTAIAYVTIRGVRVAADQVSRLMGLDNNRS
jgi:hypothetical protein